MVYINPAAVHSPIVSLSSWISLQDRGPLIPNAIRLPQESAPVDKRNFGNLALEQRRCKKAQKEACCKLV